MLPVTATKHIADSTKMDAVAPRVARSWSIGETEPMNSSPPLSPLAACEHDPDDGGDTCCNCGKVMTDADRLAYEVLLRKRLQRTLKRMKKMISRDFEYFFPRKL